MRRNTSQKSGSSRSSRSSRSPRAVGSSRPSKYLSASRASRSAPPARPEEMFSFVRDSVNSGLFFYCQKCEKQLLPTQIKEIKLRRSAKLRCTECKADEVAYGPETSMRNYFKIKN